MERLLLICFISGVLATVPLEPMDLRPTLVTHDQIKIAWQPPLGDVVVTRYRISFNDPVHQEVTIEVSPSTEHTLTHLTPGTTYYIELAAISAHGKGTAARLAVRTKHLKTPMPTNVRATRMSPTVILVTWDAPDYGDTVQYRVSYVGFPESGESRIKAPVTQFSFRTNQPSAVFMVTVAALSVDGRWSASTDAVMSQAMPSDGEWSPWGDWSACSATCDQGNNKRTRFWIGRHGNETTFKTEDARTCFSDIACPVIRKPKRIRVHAINTTAISVEWQSPKMNYDDDVIIIGYSVTYKRLDDDAKVLSVNTLETSPTERRVVLSSLRPGTAYSIHVSAYTNTQEGMPSKTKTIRTKHAAIPVLVVTVHADGDTVIWFQRSASADYGNPRHYHVIVVPTEGDTIAPRANFTVIQKPLLFNNKVLRPDFPAFIVWFPADLLPLNYSLNDTWLDPSLTYRAFLRAYSENQEEIWSSEYSNIFPDIIHVCYDRDNNTIRLGAMYLPTESPCYLCMCTKTAAACTTDICTIKPPDENCSQYELIKSRDVCCQLECKHLAVGRMLALGRARGTVLQSGTALVDDFLPIADPEGIYFNLQGFHQVTTHFEAVPVCPNAECGVLKMYMYGMDGTRVVMLMFTDNRDFQWAKRHL